MAFGDLSSRFDSVFERLGGGQSGRQSGGVIQGSGGNDVIIGNSDSRNTIIGLDGNDQILGGNVGDTIFTGSGSSLALGQGGGDKIFGSFGDDQLSGGDGDDRIFAGLGNDFAVGGAGNDFITGDLGSDTLLGDAGDDRLYAGLGDDIVLGGDGDDQIDGSGGGDVLFGGAGDDEITGGTNGDPNGPPEFFEDFVVGGTGSDTLNAFGGGVGTIERDNLVGGGFADAAGNVDVTVRDTDPDTFVLGDDLGSFYVGNGGADFAIIWDYTPGVDILGLSAASEYAFGAASIVSGSDTAIAAITPNGPDLIAVLVGVSPASVGLG